MPWPRFRLGTGQQEVKDCLVEIGMKSGWLSASNRLFITCSIRAIKGKDRREGLFSPSVGSSSQSMWLSIFYILAMAMDLCVRIWISYEPARCMWLLIVLCLIVLCNINSLPSNEERCAFATNFPRCCVNCFLPKFNTLFMGRVIVCPGLLIPQHLHPFFELFQSLSGNVLHPLAAKLESSLSQTINVGVRLGSQHWLVVTAPRPQPSSLPTGTRIMWKIVLMNLTEAS